MLKPQVFPDHEALSRHAADWLAARLREQPDALLCAATGATPLRTYQLLSERHRDEPNLFAHLRLIKLDEWGGLAPDDPASCERHLRELLVDPLKLHDRYIAFDNRPADPQAECDRVAAWLAQHGPIDLCVLGLGTNGHLGFNEPAAALPPHAHVATLSETSLSHSMLTTARTRPTYGLTLGIADLLQARRVVLLVSGPSKQAPLRELLAGPVRTNFPASLLALHPQVDLLCDQSALPTPP